MAWFIVDDAGWTEARGHADCKIHYGPFSSQAEAQAFADEPENDYFDEAHGPIVELVWELAYGEDGADYEVVGVFGEDRHARERIVADALAGNGAAQATITRREVGA